jgi:hypothetical protein
MRRALEIVRFFTECVVLLAGALIMILGTVWLILVGLTLLYKG